MYKNLVVLDRNKHKNLKLSPFKDLGFVKNSMFIPVVASEVVSIGTTFPVIFTTGENPSLVSLLSLGGDNLAIDSDGQWSSSYIPSFIKKYPFSLSNMSDDPEKKVILIDEDSVLLSKSKGKQLFKKNGNQSETLTHSIDILKSHENMMIVTKNIAKVIAQSGILDDRAISIGEGKDKKVLVNGFKVVNKDKLNALSDEILADWARKGIINMINEHIKSLDNIHTLFNLMNKRQS